MPCLQVEREQLHDDGHDREELDGLLAVHSQLGESGSGFAFAFEDPGLGQLPLAHQLDWEAELAFEKLKQYLMIALEEEDVARDCD